MASIPQRITNGQRAAVCGLIIAGLTMTESCRIVGIPRNRFSELVPPNWHARSRKPRRWRPEQLSALCADYHDPAQRTQTIADRYGVSVSQISKLAKIHGWTMRVPGNKPKPGSIRSMTPQQRTHYFKLRRDLNMPRLSAAAEALR